MTPRSCSALDTTILDDGQVKVCLTENGRTVCATVSSAHLVPDKEPQLKRALKSQP
jgi:hypothetical protein